MKNKTLLWLLLIVIISGCSGCWDKKDIKNMLVATVESIDTPAAGDRNGDRYHRESLLVSGTNWGKRSYQIISASGPVFIYSTPGIQAQTGGEYLFSGLSTYIIGRDLAERGVEEIIKVITKTPDLPYTMQCVISEKRASEILQTQNPSYPEVGEYLKRLLAQSGRSLLIPQANVFALAQNLKNQRCSMVPLVGRNGHNLEITGVGLFNLDKLQVVLNREDAQIASMLRGEKGGPGRIYIAGKTGDQNQQLVVLVTTHRKVKVSLHNGNYIFTILVYLEGTVREDVPTHNFIDEKQFFPQVEELTSQAVQTRCMHLVDRMQQEWKFDAFNLGKFAYARYGNPSLVEDWNQIVPESIVNVKVYTHLTGAGDSF